MALEARHEVQARRLIAQGLAASAARPALTNAYEVTRHLLALQGQTYRAGVRAIALRVNNGLQVSEETVREAIAQHRIVRAWPMRGTLHFLPAEDARWLMQLCVPRLRTAHGKLGLGFGPEDFERAYEALHSHLLNLSTGQLLARKDAYQLFADAGVDPGQGRGPHLLRAFGGMGDLVQGLPEGRNETFMHVDRLATKQREVHDDERLAELGERYIQGHGPVTIDDLAWWSYLTKRDCKLAFENAQNVLPLRIGGTDYMVPAWQHEVTTDELEAALEQTFYLPAFDEYLLGYKDKSFTMADEIRHEVLTKNGISWDFTVKNGTVTGRTV